MNLLYVLIVLAAMIAATILRYQSNDIGEFVSNADEVTRYFARSYSQSFLQMAVMAGLSGASQHVLSRWPFAHGPVAVLGHAREGHLVGARARVGARVGVGVKG